MSYRYRKISGRAEQIADAVREGKPASTAAFAQYLAEQGELGNGVDEFIADMTVAQMVEAYLKSSISAQREMVAWAKVVAEDEQAEAEVFSAA